jgi:hypothetical protein
MSHTEGSVLESSSHHFDGKRPTRRFAQVMQGPGLEGGSLTPGKRRPRNLRGRFILSLTSPSLKKARPGRPLPMRIIATSRPIVISTRRPMRAISGAQRCTWVSLTSLSASRKYPPLQKLFSAARCSTSIKDVAIVPPRSGHKLPPALYTSPSTNYIGPSVSHIPRRAIPVNEVYKWHK